MTEKRSKYDTDPLDPEFVRRTEENLWGATRSQQPEETEPLAPHSVTEEPTRRFDEQMAESYPSVFVPPAYQPPRPPQPQPFTTFGAGSHQPPATTSAPSPGPASPYPGPHAQQGSSPTSRPVARLGLPENVAVVLPYLPFYIGLVASIIELAMVPRQETRVRFHAAQGLALQLAILAISFLFKFVTMASGSGLGAALFSVAALVFLVVSAIRVWQGKPHHITALDEPARWLGDKIAPTQ